LKQQVADMCIAPVVGLRTRLHQHPLHLM
jgi:hypothetical protein